MQIIAQLSDAGQKALERDLAREQQWTTADFMEIVFWTLVCAAGGVIVDTLLRSLIPKKPV